MTAVSFSVARGAATGNLSVSAAGSQTITVGTLAPSASFDIELRWQQLDLNSKDITRKDIILALKLFRRALLQYGGQVSISSGVIGPP